MSSIFTKIINGEMQSHKVYEDDHSLVILDAYPKSTGHTLIIPKHEVVLFDELSLPEAQQLLAVVYKVTQAVKQSLSPHYNIVLNNGPTAGQVVPHVHFHVIPRYSPGENIEPKDESSAEIAQKIADSMLT